MVEVIVPATSANIGPGFDSLGIALNVYNKFIVEEIEEGLIIEGCEEKYADESNLIYQSMLRCFEEIGYKPKGIRISIETNVPVSRGLGSSATCIVGGIVAANEIAGSFLNKKKILELATEIEGHPDNVAPAIFGGMVASVYDEKVYYSKVKVADGLKFLALIPDFKLSTKKSRSILPKVVPHSDAVFNVGRTALMISALQNGEFDLLKIGGQDKLHQHYRGTLIDGYDIILEHCNNIGAKGVFLSGAGPTILVAIEESDKDTPNKIKQILDTLENKWQIKELSIDYNGVISKKE